MNSVNLISCPKCRHDNSRDSAEAAGTVSCASCGHSIQIKPESVPFPKKSRSKDSLDIIPVRCSQCQKKFGVKTRSAGKEVACPHCKAPQVAPQVAPTIAPQRTGHPRASEQNESSAGRDTSPAVDKTANTNSSATVDHSISPDVMELLPPRYLVPQSLELTTASPASKIKIAKVKMNSGFEIDTGMLRLPVGDSVAEVRTLTREKRDQRKRIRVAIVYLVGIIVLVGVFWWLMSRTVIEIP